MRRRRYATATYTGRWDGAFKCGEGEGKKVSKLLWWMRLRGDVYKLRHDEDSTNESINRNDHIWLVTTGSGGEITFQEQQKKWKHHWQSIPKRGEEKLLRLMPHFRWKTKALYRFSSLLFSLLAASESHNLCWCVNKKLITCNINFLVRVSPCSSSSTKICHIYESS